MALIDVFAIISLIVLFQTNTVVRSYTNYSYTTSDTVNEVISIKNFNLITDGNINGNIKFEKEDITEPTNFNISNLMESTTDEEALIPRQNTEEDYIRYCVPEGNCLSFCCPPGFYTLPKNKCERIKNTSIPLPRVYAMDLSPMNVTTNDKNFHFLYWNPCIGAVKTPLNPAIYPEEQFFLLQNGSFYLPFSEKGKQILNPRQYCLSVIKSVVLKEYLVIYCDKEEIKGKSVIRGILISLGMIVSIPFLLATWLVYTLIKELRNLHGFVLRAYIASLTISYTILSTVQIAPQEWISNVCCIFLGKLTINVITFLTFPRENNIYLLY